MSFKIFIDTEFTDFIDIHLISIGMVAQSGEEFYAEVPYPHGSCNAVSYTHLTLPTTPYV